MPYWNWLQDSDIGGMTVDVTTRCGCWNDPPINFKNTSSIAAYVWLSSFKKSNISLEEVSEASILSEFIISFISVKRLSVRYGTQVLFNTSLKIILNWKKIILT